MLSDSLEEVDDKTKGLAKNFGSLYDASGKKKLSGAFEMLGFGAVNSVKQLTFLGDHFKDFGNITNFAGGAMMEFAGAAGPLAPIVYAVGAALQLTSELLVKYNKILGTAIDVGLGYSDSLGKAATIAGASGLSLESFYEAVKEAGQGMRALGGNGEEAAQNFAKLQTEVRNTYGTFGMSNADMAKMSATYVNLMGTAGLKGVDAAKAAAESQGKSMNEMRKISIATGISLSKVAGSFKELVTSPIISNSLKAFGNNTADAAMKLARGASSFEAVFGDLGKNLYKQMKEAQAAGLSIINTTLGAEVAPFVDVRLFEQFAKASEEGGSAMVHASQQFTKSIEPNLQTLRLLAATGDQSAKSMLEMYNNATKFTSMSDDEIAALDAKKRAEEKFKTVQEKMNAAFEMMYNKLFGLIDMIPIELVEGIGDGFEYLGDVVGMLIDVLVAVMKPVSIAFQVLGIGIKALFAVVRPFIDAIKEAVAWVTEGFGGIVDTVRGWIAYLGDGFVSIVSSVGQFLLDGVKTLWELITAPYIKVYDWFTGFISSIGNWFRSSWLGKKIFGDSGDSSSTTPVLASQADGSGMAARTAQVQAQASLQADQAKAQEQTSDDMRRLVDINAAQVAQMERVASNTGQTKEAVERNGATY